MKVKSCLKLFKFDRNWSNRSKIAQKVLSWIRQKSNFCTSCQFKGNFLKLGWNTIWRENHHHAEPGSDTEDENEDFDVDLPIDRLKTGLSRLLEVFPGTYYTQYGF